MEIKDKLEKDGEAGYPFMEVIKRGFKHTKTSEDRRFLYQWAIGYLKFPYLWENRYKGDIQWMDIRPHL